MQRPKWILSHIRKDDEDEGNMYDEGEALPPREQENKHLEENATKPNE